MKQVLEIQLTADNKAAIAGINQTSATLDKFSQAANVTTSNMGKASVAVTKAKTDFTGLSRVIQDLPYGFNAISNNLTQLIPAAGAAGLAFSGIVTAITFAQIGFQAWTRKTKEAKEETNAFNDAMKNAAKNIGEETTKLSLLYSVSTNVATSMKKRLEAANEIKDMYPKLLEGYSAEAIAAGKAKNAIDQLTEAIIRNAKAKALADKIGELEAKKVESQIQIRKIEIANINEVARARSSTVQLGMGVTANISREGEIESSNKRAKRGIEEQKKIIKDLEANQNLLKSLFDPADLLSPGGKEGKEKKNPIKEAFDELRRSLESIKQLYTDRVITNEVFNAQSIDAYTSALRKLVSAGLNPLSAEYRKLVQEQNQFLRPNNKPLADIMETERDSKTKKLMEIKSPNGSIKGGSPLLTEAASMDKQREDTAKAMNKQFEQMASVAMQAANSVDSLFSAMENGLSLGDAIGKMFEDLAKQIAKAAIKASIFSAILSILPGATSAAGAASGGKSGFFGLFSGFLKGFASGGTVSGPSSGYPAILHGTEHIMRPDQLNRIVMGAAQVGSMSGMGSQRVEVVGKVSGNDIWLSQQRTDFYRGLTTGR